MHLFLTNKDDAQGHNYCQFFLWLVLILIFKETVRKMKKEIDE